MTAASAGGGAAQERVPCTAFRLADGRDLYFYDDAPGRTHRVDDRRPLPPRPAPSTMRHDPVLDEWVVYASHRQDRTHLPPVGECPLCVSTAGVATEIPADNYDVVVFENRFPALPALPEVPPHRAAASALWVPERPVGRCEVVCFTPDHTASFSQLDPVRARTVAGAWADRTTALSALPGVEQVFVFENRGAEIGVTLEHPHGQIYAYPYVPSRSARALASARQHERRTGTCLFCATLDQELDEARRVVVAGEHVVAYVPYASRWPYAVNLMPRRHVPDLAALTEAETVELMSVYVDLLGRFDRLFGSPAPYIAAWHQAPVRRARDLGHLTLELFTVRRARGKLKYLAGSESGAGAFINDVRPEDAADRLVQLGQPI